MENLFILALKHHYRFNYRGLITLEDLWDLRYNDLDIIYKDLMNKKKELDVDSLLETKKDNQLELINNQIAIVKYIFEEKVREENERKEVIKEKERKQRIMELITKKKEAALDNLSIEELEKLLVE